MLWNRILDMKAKMANGYGSLRNKATQKLYPFAIWDSYEMR